MNCVTENSRSGCERKRFFSRLNDQSVGSNLLLISRCGAECGHCTCAARTKVDTFNPARHRNQNKVSRNKSWSCAEDLVKFTELVRVREETRVRHGERV